MDNKALLLDMFTLQQKLNDGTNGEGWEKGYTNHNRIINWRRCIYMESAELIDSFNWKHWKDINIAPDWDNITIELVDIWHFVMSLGLEEYKNKNLGDVEALVNYVDDTKYFDDFCGDSVVPEDEDALSIVSVIEHLMKHSLENKDFEIILDDFFVTSLQCGLNMKRLYKFYIGKNILNKFRQDNGYKEGSYKKSWNGVEDNVVMTELLEQNSLGADGLYQALEQAYKAL
jgi:dimeric dUTPase (all-alpha-NTP-PPase superfamily)